MSTLYNKIYLGENEILKGYIGDVELNLFTNDETLPVHSVKDIDATQNSFQLEYDVINRTKASVLFNVSNVSEGFEVLFAYFTRLRYFEGQLNCMISHWDSGMVSKGLIDFEENVDYIVTFEDKNNDRFRECKIYNNGSLVFSGIYQVLNNTDFVIRARYCYINKLEVYEGLLTPTVKN